NWRKALKNLLQAEKLDPENPNIHNELGLVYMNLGEHPSSLQHFKKALALK
ncbi:tetratricopeptide repeat protein, partial [Candidatus Saccharibacteria bacterium]|nr:tetratricopeptide repeat protein [Candidatus Saccharibacteria bacterium]